MLESLRDIEARFSEAEMELMPEDEMMLLTWSPNPVRYLSKEPRKQYKQLLRNYLVKVCMCFGKYCFAPELNKNGNVHIHGWFVLGKYPHNDGLKKWYTFWLPKLKRIGFVKIDKATCNEAPLHYYKKDMTDMYEIFANTGLPYPISHTTECAHIKKLRITRAKHIMREPFDKNQDERPITEWMRRIEELELEIKSRIKKSG